MAELFPVQHWREGFATVYDCDRSALDTAGAGGACPDRQTGGVTTAHPEIACDELRQKIDDGDRFVLVDALSTISYAGAHLPGAIHIPPERVDTLAPRRIPDQGTEIVVYCSSPSCVSSAQVASTLVELGYTNVRHFAGGKDAWRSAGHPLEGGRV